MTFSTEVLLEAIATSRVIEEVFEDVFGHELSDGDVEVLDWGVRGKEEGE
jgi:hypothetical protein